jgi:hypothetical protein
MLAKPLADMDEAEAVAAFQHWKAAESSARQRLKAVSDEFTTARILRDKAAVELRDRFAIDPKTGKRLGRKGRGLL